MKPKIALILLLVLLVSCACGPKMRIASGPPAQPSLNDAFFSRAEDFYQKKTYPKALALYTRYLSATPEGQYAETALMKVAAIYSHQGRKEKARTTYRRLIEAFPENRFAADAMFKHLVALKKAGSFKAAILQAADIIEKSNSPAHIIQTYVILGDIYVKAGMPTDAIYFYTLAHHKAPAKKLPDITARLEKAASILKTEEILSLLLRIKDPLPRGYLLYYLGLRRIEAKENKEAVDVLTGFVQKFPRHKNADQAKATITRLTQREAFNRNVIGCLLPLSGQWKTYGEKALESIEMAFSQYNDNHPNAPIDLIVRDTGADPETAKIAALELIQKRVAAIIGPMVTSEVVAAAAQVKKIPMIALSQKDPLPELGDYVFRNFLTPQMQVHAIVTFAMEQLGLSRFVVLFPNEKYGRTFEHLFRETVVASGGEIVAAASYEKDQTDFGDCIQTFVKKETREGTTKKHQAEVFEAISDFDAVFIPDAPEKIRLIAPQLVYYDIKDVLLLGTNLWHSQQLIEMADGYVQGAIFADAFYLESRRPVVKNFISLFESIYQKTPGFMEAIAYDTTTILLKMVSNPEIKSHSDLKTALAQLTDFDGVTGPTSFDQTGEAHKKLYLFEIRGDEIFEIE